MERSVIRVALPVEKGPRITAPVSAAAARASSASLELGVGRSYTSRVIQTFKAEGILETRRGSILVRRP